MKNRRNIYNYRLHEGAMDSFCPALAVTEKEVKDLVNVTLTDDNAKSIYIYAEPDSMIGDEIEDQIESHLNATVEDVSNEFLAVSGEEIDANFINSALRGTGDENFDNITTIFVANAENADVSVLSKLGIEYKVIAVASVVDPEKMEDTCNALGNAYECFDCSDAADLLSGKAENFDIYYDDNDDNDDYYDDTYSLDDLGESVSSRFAKYARLYEDLNEDDDTDDTDDAEDSNKDNDNDSDDDVEDVDVSAVVVTVNKDDVDKCKDELIDAGVSEDDIEVLDDDNEDSDNTDIKIDVNSIVEVKDWIENKKGEGAFKDLTGIEIVDSEDDSDDDSDSDNDEEHGDKSDSDELSDDDFDFGDIFANAEKDDKKNK